MTVAVNGTHLKGWDGREVFELISILLKDEKFYRGKANVKDAVIMEQYSKTSDNEDVGIMPLSKPDNNNETQEIEAIDVSPTI